MAGVRRLGVPRRAAVEAGPGGVPTAVARKQVDAVNEEWVVEDRWWTGEPAAPALLRAGARGRAPTRSCSFDLSTRRWFVQRG